MVLDPGEAGRARELDPAERRRQVRKAAIASVVGTSIEWYDFFLYNTAAAIVFKDVFFPGSSDYAGTLSAFATYAVGFALATWLLHDHGWWAISIAMVVSSMLTLTALALLPDRSRVDITRSESYA
jgi:hypothetical protein